MPLSPLLTTQSTRHRPLLSRHDVGGQLGRARRTLLTPNGDVEACVARVHESRVSSGWTIRDMTDSNMSGMIMHAMTLEETALAKNFTGTW
jgi:hypothetical protein